MRENYYMNDLLQLPDNANLNNFSNLPESNKYAKGIPFGLRNTGNTCFLLVLIQEFLCNPIWHTKINNTTNLYHNLNRGENCPCILCKLFVVTSSVQAGVSVPRPFTSLNAIMDLGFTLIEIGNNRSGNTRQSADLEDANEAWNKVMDMDVNIDPLPNLTWYQIYGYASFMEKHCRRCSCVVNVAFSKNYGFVVTPPATETNLTLLIENNSTWEPEEGITRCGDHNQCDSCEVYYKKRLLNTPRVLKIHLPRATGSDEETGSVRVVVEPEETLNISDMLDVTHYNVIDYADIVSNVQCLYSLYCIICHTGSHYICYNKRLVDTDSGPRACWFCTDDSRVSTLSFDEMIKCVKTNGVMFYYKIKNESDNIRCISFVSGVDEHKNMYEYNRVSQTYKVRVNSVMYAPTNLDRKRNKTLDDVCKGHLGKCRKNVWGCMTNPSCNRLIHTDCDNDNNNNDTFSEDENEELNFQHRQQQHQQQQTCNSVDEDEMSDTNSDGSSSESETLNGQNDLGTQFHRGVRMSSRLRESGYGRPGLYREVDEGEEDESESDDDDLLVAVNVSLSENLKRLFSSDIVLNRMATGGFDFVDGKCIQM